MTMVLLTVTYSPEKAGTLARRIVLAMQPPVAVPENGGPWLCALVTRPEGANVIVKLAVPEGSPCLRQEDAWAATLASALRAASGSKAVSGAAGGGAL